MENKGVIKYKNKEFRKLADTTRLASAIFACTMIPGIILSFGADQTKAKIDDIGSEIKETQSFKEYFNEKHTEYYEALSAGRLSEEEFADKVTEISSEDNIIANAEYYAADRVDEIDELQDKYLNETKGALGFTFMGGLGAIMTALPAAMMRYSKAYSETEDEQEQEM